MPVILRVEGFSLEVIALLPVASVPYLLKFLWAPLLDRNGGGENHYKRWILWTGLAYGVLLVLLGSLDLIADFKLVAALVLTISAIASTQDLAINALYIKLMSFEERGTGSSSKVLALNVGSILGSGCFLLVYNHFGWHAAASGIGVLVLASLSLNNHILLYLTVGLINVAITVASVVSATMFMDYARKGQESVDYSLQITGTHLGGMIMATASGSIITAIGYTAFFTWQAVFAAVMILITACVFRASRVPELS